MERFVIDLARLSARKRRNGAAWSTRTAYPTSSRLASRLKHQRNGRPPSGPTESAFISNCLFSLAVIDYTLPPLLLSRGPIPPIHPFFTPACAGLDPASPWSTLNRRSRFAECFAHPPSIQAHPLPSSQIRRSRVPCTDLVDPIPLPPRHPTRGSFLLVECPRGDTQLLLDRAAIFRIFRISKNERKTVPSRSVTMARNRASYMPKLSIIPPNSCHGGFSPVRLQAGLGHKASFR